MVVTKTIKDEKTGIESTVIEPDLSIDGVANSDESPNDHRIEQPGYMRNRRVFPSTPTPKIISKHAPLTISLPDRSMIAVGEKLTEQAFDDLVMGVCPHVLLNAKSTAVSSIGSDMIIDAIRGTTSKWSESQMATWHHWADEVKLWSHHFHSNSGDVAKEIATPVTSEETDGGSENEERPRCEWCDYDGYPSADYRKKYLDDISSIWESLRPHEEQVVTILSEPLIKVDGKLGPEIAAEYARRFNPIRPITMKDTCFDAFCHIITTIGYISLTKRLRSTSDEESAKSIISESIARIMEWAISSKKPNTVEYVIEEITEH
jgi:hypothetical protein